MPWALIRDFIGRLSRAWDAAGRPNVVVTSWYRDPASNARVGGAPRSQHLIGLALDLAPGPAAQRVAEAARREGLTVLDEGDHVHVQYSAAGLLDRSLWG